MIRMRTRIHQINDERSRFAQNKNIIHHIVTKIEYDNMEKKKVIIWCFYHFCLGKKERRINRCNTWKGALKSSFQKNDRL